MRGHDRAVPLPAKDSAPRPLHRHILRIRPNRLETQIRNGRIRINLLRQNSNANPPGSLATHSTLTKATTPQESTLPKGRENQTRKNQTETSRVSLFPLSFLSLCSLLSSCFFLLACDASLSSLFVRVAVSLSWAC